MEIRSDKLEYIVFLDVGKGDSRCVEIRVVCDGRSVTFSPLVEPVDGIVCGSVGLLVVTTPSAVALLFAVVW